MPTAGLEVWRQEAGSRSQGQKAGRLRPATWVRCWLRPQRQPRRALLKVLVEFQIQQQDVGMNGNRMETVMLSKSFFYFC